MNTSIDLNDLIVEGTESSQPQRGERLLTIDRKKKDIGAVKVLTENKRTLLDRVFKRDVERVLIVRTARSASLLPIQLESEDVASEVRFQLTLKLDVQTPSEDNEEALKQLGHAFRDATLHGAGQAGVGGMSDTPAGRLETELKQWLKTRYRLGKSLSKHSDRAWLAGENAAIADHILKEYGLDTHVKLRVQVASELRLGPVSADVTTTAKDSDKVLEFSVKLGCKLKGSDVFAAPALTETDLKERISEQTDLFVRQNVALQDFRFETRWINQLEAHLEAFLKDYERTITEFHVPLAQNAIYSKGPHPIEAGKASFSPAGWHDDDIKFSGNGQIIIENAALYEAGRSHSSLLQTPTELHNWLKGALQEAVSEELHRVHDQNVGYAVLLANWEGADGYREAIQDNLAARARAEGLNADTIIAQPDREEMGLLKGATIELGSDPRPCLEPDAHLEFDASVQIKIDRFEDIKDLLNRTNRPMQDLRDELISGILSRACRKIPYLRFYQFFESGPWPVKEGDGKADDSGCVGWLKAELTKELLKHRITLVSFTARQTSNEYYRVFDSLQRTVPETVRFTIERRAARVDGEHSPESVLEEFLVSFQLDINGLNGEKIGAFFREWERFQSLNEPIYSAIRHDVEEKLPGMFTPEDRALLMGTEEIGKEFRDACHKLVQDRLSEFLGKTYGLSGEGIGIDVINKTWAGIALDEHDALVEKSRKAIKAQSKLDDEITQKKAGTQLAAFTAKADDFVEGADADDAPLTNDQLQIEQPTKKPRSLIRKFEPGENSVDAGGAADENDKPES